uniref:WcbI family polysaccharide biosynthesis putative acetyltransferase n=1 Tax=uncultured Thiocystis sp. TaxID=1202134 RepID=UPI0025DE9DF0
MRIYFHGNCQMTPLQKMIAEVYPDWMSSVREVHTPEAIADEALFRTEVKSADVVIAQPVRGGYRGIGWLSFASILELVRPDCRVITIPSLFFRGQLPCWYYLGRSEGRFPSLRMRYHNLHIAAMTVIGMSDQEASKTLYSSDLYTREFVNSQLHVAIKAIQDREQEHQMLRVSDLYEESCRLEPVGHTINHPTRTMMAKIANRILCELGFPPSVSPEGEDYLSKPHLPLLPSVEQHLGLPLDAQRNAFAGSRWLPLDDYCRRVMAFYRTLPEGHLLQAILETKDAVDFLTAYASYHPDADWANIDRWQEQISSLTLIPPSPLDTDTENESVSPVETMQPLGSINALAFPQEVQISFTLPDFRDTRFIFSDDQLKEKIVTQAPFVNEVNYAPATFSAITIPDATLVCFPRSEATLLTNDLRVVDQSRASHRYGIFNPYLYEEKDMTFLKQSLAPTIKLKSAFIGYDNASYNYCHFMMYFLPRFVYAIEGGTEAEVVFPLLPNYRDIYTGAINFNIIFFINDYVKKRYGRKLFFLNEGCVHIEQVEMIA